MRTWDYFFPDVLPEVLGCPEPTVERHIQRAAIRFCDKSRCWSEDLDRITTRAGKAVYDISFPDGAEGVQIVGATIDGLDIGVELEQGTSMGHRRVGNSGRRRVVSLDGLVTVTLMPTPGSDGQDLRLRCTLRPTEDATGLPDRIATKFRTAISDGALATLLAMNKGAWINPQLAGVKQGLFTDAINTARERAFRGQTNAQPRTVTSFF